MLSDEGFIGNNEWCQDFMSPPTNDVTLQSTRAATCFRHTMIGKSIRSSLDSFFQVELMESDEDFEKVEDYDGILL